MFNQVWIKNSYIKILLAAINTPGITKIEEIRPTNFLIGDKESKSSKTPIKKTTIKLTRINCILSNSAQKIKENNRKKKSR